MSSQIKKNPATHSLSPLSLVVPVQKASFADWLKRGHFRAAKASHQHSGLVVPEYPISIHLKIYPYSFFNSIFILIIQLFFHAFLFLCTNCFFACSVYAICCVPAPTTRYCMRSALPRDGPSAPGAPRCGPPPAPQDPAARDPAAPPPWP